MRYKTTYLILVFLLLITPILAQQQSWGTVKKGECIDFMQSCANCTYVNFTTVISPNKMVVARGLESQKRGTDYNYTFCNTSVIGTYIVNGVGDVNGVDTVFAVDFDVNPSGKETSLNVGMGIGIIIIITMLIIFGAFMIYYAEGPLKFVALLATMLLLVFGLNVVANMATDTNMSETVINLLWMIYRMTLYSFFAMFFFVLVKFITLLKIERNPPPRIDSPLKLVKARRKEKYAYKHGRY